MSPSGGPPIQFKRHSAGNAPSVRETAFHSEDEYRLAERRPLARTGDWTSHGPQRIFGIAGKGRIAEGYDADLTLVDLNARGTIRHADMASRAGWTLFDGFKAKGWPVATIIRGRVVMRDSELREAGLGDPARFVETLAAT